MEGEAGGHHGRRNDRARRFHTTDSNTLRDVFSGRVPHERRPNRLSAALAAAKRTQLLDLTLSNPTRAGIHYPDSLLASLSQPAALAYCPEPFGLPDARQAVADFYSRRGVLLEPVQVVLTASTSEAYSLLFKLLCDPARANVLTPVPSYPLFDHLTSLDGVEQRRYSLEYHGEWSIAPDEIDRQWTDRTRAVLAVSPNNPTGSCLTSADAHVADRSLCRAGRRVDCR